MPCSFCRSRSHNIRYCNSPEIQYITENLIDEAVSSVRHCNYQRFSQVVNRMHVNQIKIACIHWHNTISPELYDALSSMPNTIPQIRCNFSREKYIFIVMWLYLKIAHCITPEEHVIYENGYSITECFRERLEYLRRIVIFGMSEYDSYDIYLEFILEDRDRYLNAVSRRIDFDSVAFGFSSPSVFEEQHVSKTKKYSFLIEQGDADDFKKDIYMDEEGSYVDCPICYEKITPSCVVLGCKHNVCTECFVGYLNSRNSAVTCAICRADIANVKTYDEEFVDKLKSYTNAEDNYAEKLIHEEHVPERFEDGDNIVINLV